MSNRKGFTLIEIIVVLVIIAITSMIAIPSYLAFMKKGESQSAWNNLIAIYAAEKNYYLNNGNYCTGSALSSDCGYSLANINAGLSLTIPADSYFTYQCTGSLFCYAQARDGTFGYVVTGTLPLSSTNPACSYGACPTW